MYQMATSRSNVPNNTNLELVLDIDSMHLLGVSEAGTTKTIEFQRNPRVSISWCRQLRIPEEVRAGKLAYITSSVNGGAMVIYEVVPSRIIITAPFLMNMSPSMANAARFATVLEGEDKYAYDLFLSDAFLDALVAYKAEYIASEEGKAAVEAYYATGMYPMLDGLCAQYGMPTSLQLALIPTSAALN